MPETTPYLILGLVVSAVLLLGLIGSMVARHRNLERDLVLIEELAREE